MNLENFIQDNKHRNLLLEKISANNLNVELEQILNTLEQLNSDLVLKQNHISDFYIEYLLEKKKHQPTFHFKIGEYGFINFSKSFNYYRDICKKDYLKRKFNMIYKFKNTEPLKFKFDLNYTLDVWNLKFIDKNLNKFDLKKLLFLYKFYSRQKIYEVLSEYWNLYIYRFELELKRKRLKYQKQNIINFNFAKKSNSVNYTYLIHSILDWKLQLNSYKDSVSYYEKKYKYFLINNVYPPSNYKFKYLNITLKNLWANFNTLTLFFKKKRYELLSFKESLIVKNMKLKLMKEVFLFKKSISDKFPRFEIFNNYNREYEESNIKQVNIKNKLSKLEWNPLDEVNFGCRFSFNLFDKSFNWYERNFYKNKILTTKNTIKQQLYIENIETNNFNIKLNILENEIRILYLKMLIVSKEYNYKKQKSFAKNTYVADSWRESELRYYTIQLMWKQKIFDFFRLTMLLDLRGLYF